MEASNTTAYYHQAINLALDYLHANLQNDLNLSDVASIANISPFHFHRIFKDKVGESLHQYIRRLRLERAALLLQTYDIILIEIAKNTGYQTQYSLSKAFKQHFGESPRAYRAKVVHPLRKQSIPPEPDQIPEPMILKADEIQLVYIRIVAPYGSAIEYDAAWKSLLNHAKNKRLLTKNSEYLGLSLDDPAITPAARCRFYACITTKEKVKPEGPFGSLKLNGGEYAVFSLKGAYEQLNDLYQLIYLYWLPRSKRNLRSGLPFEKYLNSPDQVAQEELLTEIWLPVS